MKSPSTFDDSSLPTSPTLVARVRANEATAWQRLVDLCGPLVFAWAGRGGLSHDDAADVIQEVFASVAKAIGRFDPSAKGRFRGWPWTITRNKVRNHYRRRSPFEARGGDTAIALLVQLPESWDDDNSEVTRDDVRALYHRARKLIRADFEPQT